MANTPVNPLKRLLQAMIRFAHQRETDKIPRASLGFLIRPYTRVDDLVQLLADAGVPEHTEEPEPGKRGYPGKYYLLNEVIHTHDQLFGDEEESRVKSFLA